MASWGNKDHFGDGNDDGVKDYEDDDEDDGVDGDDDVDVDDTDTCTPLQKQHWREVPRGAAVEKADLQKINKFHFLNSKFVSNFSILLLLLIFLRIFAQ